MSSPDAGYRLPSTEQVRMSAAVDAYAQGEQAIGAMGLDEDLAEAAIDALRARRRQRLGQEDEWV